MKLSVYIADPYRGYSRAHCARTHCHWFDKH